MTNLFDIEDRLGITFLGEEGLFKDQISARCKITKLIKKYSSIKYRVWKYSERFVIFYRIPNEQKA